MWFLRKAGSQKKVTKVGQKREQKKSNQQRLVVMTSFPAQNNDQLPSCKLAHLPMKSWPWNTHGFRNTRPTPQPPPFSNKQTTHFRSNAANTRNRSSEPNDLVSLSESVGNSQEHWNSIPSLSTLPSLQLQDQIWNLHLQNHRPEIGSGGFKESKFKVCIYWITGNLYINFGRSIISMSHCW